MGSDGLKFLAFNLSLNIEFLFETALFLIFFFAESKAKVFLTLKSINISETLLIACFAQLCNEYSERQKVVFYF